MVARGHYVHIVFSPHRTDELFLKGLERLQKQGMGVAQIPMAMGPSPNDLRTFFRIRANLRASGPFDVVHGHSSKGGAFSRLSAKAIRAASVYTPHGFYTMYPGTPKRRKEMYARAERTLARRTDAIICVSDFERRHGLSLGINPNRLHLIPNGVDIPEDADREEARRRMGIEAEEFCLGYVGRLVSIKAPEVLIHALAQMKHQEARLALVGDGPLAEQCRGLAASLGVKERIRWLGEVDARPLMPGFDTFVLCSISESYPYVLLEAAAVGVPCVTTAAGGAPEIVNGAGNGTVVPVGDSAALALALDALAQDPERRRKLSEAGREFILRNGVGNMVEQTERLYRRVLAARDGDPLPPTTTS